MKKIIPFISSMFLSDFSVSGLCLVSYAAGWTWILRSPFLFLFLRHSWLLAPIRFVLHSLLRIFLCRSRPCEGERCPTEWACWILLVVEISVRA
jgi:hypothetical protein